MGFPRRAVLLAGAGLGEAGARAQSPSWRPDRPLRLIVPFPAGGSADVQARLLAEPLGRALQQPVVVENRPGAGGTLGAAEAARAPPDAHTLLLATTGTQAVNRWLVPRLGYDPVVDFAPITLVADYPQCLAVGPRWPGADARSFEGVVAALRARPDPAPFGSSGIGSPTHLAGEMAALVLGVRLEHVPYRGQGPALNDLIAGRLLLMFPSIADALGQLRGGGVHALAVLAPTRSGAIPDVPTTAEVGHPGLVSSIWTALYTRAGSPPEAIARLNEAAVGILADSTFAQRLGDAGFELRPGTPAALAAFQAAETQRWGEVVRTAGIRLE